MIQANKRVLLLSYSDLRYDGRLRELLKVTKNVGETYTLIRGNMTNDAHNYSISKTNLKGIFEFIKTTLRICKIESIDAIILDNRMSCVPGIFIKIFYPNILIIQDVRELYLINERRGIKSKLGCFIEAWMFKRSDLVICANIFRARKMLEDYRLPNLPFVYENLRKLEYKNPNEPDLYRKKYAYLLKENLPIIISTSGCDLKRTNDKLVKEFIEFSENSILLLVGGGSKEDQIVIKDIITENKIKNVYLIDKVAEGELKYLLSIAKVGVVNYGMYDTNNIFCASGKIYEFLYELIPVITTINPPLKDICESFGIGIANESYAFSIKHIFKNYDTYVNNIKEFLKQHSINDNNVLLTSEILKILYN